MQNSESIENIAKAFCEAQAEIGGAVKSAENPFFHSNYANLESIIKTLKPTLIKYGLSFMQMPHSDDGGVGVLTRILHTSGEWFEHSFTLPLVKPDPQAAGSAITYARRYALQAAFGIPAVDDDGEAAMFRVASKREIETLAELLVTKERDEEMLLRKIKSKHQSINDLSSAEALKAIRLLESIPS